MKRIIAIIFLIVISFGLGEKNEFVPDEAFFQQVVKKYDTDVNLSQYRFRFYEKKPNVNNAAEFYDYEYEIVSSGKIVRSVYYIKVIRRCPSRPSFAPPIYIDDDGAYFHAPRRILRCLCDIGLRDAHGRGRIFYRIVDKELYIVEPCGG